MSYEWMDDALCAQTDPELFFPDPGQTSSVAVAKRVCAECPVITKCGDHAQTLEGGVIQPYRYGTWAATSPKERAIQGGDTPAIIRDREILALSDRGLTLDEVADRLGINSRTVSRVRATHRNTGVAA